MPNITRIPAPRVVLVDLNTGIVADEWFRFFNNLYTLQYAAFGIVTPGVYGTPARVPQITVDDFGTVTAITDLLIQIDASQIVSGTLVTERGGTGQNTYTDGQLLIGTSVGNTLAKGTLGYGTGLLVTNGPGSISVGFSNANVATWAATPSSANLAAAMTDETGSGLLVFNNNPTLSTPNIDVIDFDTTYSTTLTAGQLGWDGNNTLGIGMFGGNVIQHIGEDQFFYCKATSTISKGQVVMFTGAVGASGVPTGAPATGITDGTYIMGIAAEDIATNGFGLIQSFGTLRNVNTSGYADGDILWYNPSVAGGMTKTKPSAPNVKVQMAAVINGGSSGGGTILIRINPGSTLGGTDSNAQINGGTNGDIITYNGAGGYYANSALTAGSGVSISASATGVLTISATGSGGTVTSVTGTSPVVSSGGTTPAISLASGYGDTQNPYASKTANYFLAAPNGSAGVPTFRAIVAADIPALSYVTSVSGTSPISVATGTTTPVISISQATTSTNGYLSSTDWNTFNNKVSSQWITSGSDIYYGSGNVYQTGTTSVSWVGVNAETLGGLNVKYASTASTTSGPSIAFINDSGYFSTRIPYTSSAIKSIHTSASNNERQADLAFYTHTGGAGGIGALAEVIRLFSSKGVSIGNTTDPGATNLSVTGTITSAAHTANSFIPSSSTVPTNGMYLPAANSVGIATNSTERMRFAASNNIIFGAGESTATVSSMTLRGPAAAGTDIAGSNLLISPGNGTGTGGSGYLAFYTASSGSTGATANTLTERVRIFSSGGVSIGNTTDPGATNLSVTGSITGGALSATSNAVGSVNAKTGGLTSVTAVTGSLTLATGGVTLASQVMASGSVWRITAYGTYAAASSANARTLTMACYWGSTALTSVTTGNVLAATAQTTPWRVELEISGSSATAAWCTAILSAQVTSATIPLNYIATAASVTGLTTTSTLDFRVGQTGTATSGDKINVHSVVLERIK